MNHFIRNICSCLLLSLCCAILGPAAAATLSKEESDFLRHDIDALMTLFEKGDIEALLGRTHPALYRLGGDRDEVTQAVRQAHELIKAQGVRYVSSETGVATEIYPAGDDEICFVPRTSVLEIADKRIRSVTFMIAIRPATGGAWMYLDGSALRKDPELLYTLFPALARDVPLPPITFEPVED